MDGLDNDGNYPEDPRQQNYRTSTVPINMQQGSDGTWRAPNDVSPEKKLWQQIQARNAQSRQNLQKPAQVTQKPTPSQNMMVSPTGNLSDIPDAQRWKPLNEKTSGWLSGSEQGA